MKPMPGICTGHSNCSNSIFYTSGTSRRKLYSGTLTQMNFSSKVPMRLRKVIMLYVIYRTYTVCSFVPTHGYPKLSNYVSQMRFADVIFTMETRTSA